MKELYYVHGSKENPEGARKALKHKYPDAKGFSEVDFSGEDMLYYISHNSVEVCGPGDAFLLMKEYGIELPPLAKEKTWVKRVGWCPITKYTTYHMPIPVIYDSKEAAMDAENVEVVGVVQTEWEEYC